MYQVFMEDAGHQRQLLWNSNKNTTNEWQVALVRLGGSQPVMRITFEGIRGDGYQGDIAIDDISFETCQGNNTVHFKNTSSAIDYSIYSNSTKALP